MTSSFAPPAQRSTGDQSLRATATERDGLSVTSMARQATGKQTMDHTVTTKMHHSLRSMRRLSSYRGA
jgi:uncharacterized protein involved in copper resistance